MSLLLFQKINPPKPLINRTVEDRECRTCGLKQNEEEFYFKDRKKGRRGTQCRDCEILKKGAKEVGKTRNAIALFEKGCRKCGNCKSIKSLAEFPPNKTHYGGLDNRCKICRKKELTKLSKTRTNPLNK